MDKTNKKKTFLKTKHKNEITTKKKNIKIKFSLCDKFLLMINYRMECDMMTNMCDHTCVLSSNRSSAIVRILNYEKELRSYLNLGFKTKTKKWE